MIMSSWNPILGVKPYGSADPYTTIRVPSAYSCELEDVSQPDAGRTQDGQMHKKRMGQLRKLELEWWNIPTSEVTALLQAFQEEYLWVKFWDPVRGKYSEQIFYVGNRTMPAYSGDLDIWTNLKFNLIQRNLISPYITVV